MDQIPGMIGSNGLIFVVGGNFIHLQKLMEFGFGILYGPVTVNTRVHVQWLRFLHFNLLLCSIQIALRANVTLLIPVIVWTIGLSEILGSQSLLNMVYLTFLFYFQYWPENRTNNIKGQCCCGHISYENDCNYPEHRSRRSIHSSSWKCRTTINSIFWDFVSLQFSRTNQKVDKISCRILFGIFFIWWIACPNVRDIRNT